MSAMSYSECISLGIESRIAELLDEALYSEVDTFTGTIAELRDVNASIDEAVECGDWSALRRSKNGRELVALYRARSQWREDNYDPQWDVDGMAPQDDAARESEMWLHLDDEAFSYSHRIESDLEACSVSKTVRREDEETGVEVERDESDFDTWDSQDEWARKAADQARADFIVLLRERGVDPTSKLVGQFVAKRCLAKLGLNPREGRWYMRYVKSGDARAFDHRTRLKAYRSCIAIVRRGYHTGFAYAGGPTPSR